MTYAKFHSVPLSSSTESPLVILNRKPPVSSPTESKALRIGDPQSFLSSRTWCRIHPSRHPALDAGSRQNDWIPACAGMTHPLLSRTWCGIQPCLDSLPSTEFIPSKAEGLRTCLRGNDRRKENGNRRIKNFKFDLYYFILDFVKLW